MPGNEPHSALAAALAQAAVGRAPVSVRRFPTGLQHYVYDVTFLDRAPVVVRIASEESRDAMRDAYQLSSLLRPLGVKLPEIIAADLHHPYAHLVLERFAGTDLGAVVPHLSEASLRAIAGEVAHAQEIVALTPSAGRYGYAATPTAAPYERWSDVLRAILSRARSHIVRVGLFDPAPLDVLSRKIEAARPELDAIAATPFLHDTTTKNVIVKEGGEFSGIVDVDNLCYGDPRLAPALTLASLVASGGPESYVANWMSAVGLRDDRLFRLYVALFLADFMSEHGRTFNGNMHISLPDDRARLGRLLQEQTARGA